MFRDIPVGNRAMHEMFMRKEKRRHRMEVDFPRKVVEDNWCTAIDPTGARIKTTTS